MKRNKDSVRDLWDNIKCINILIIWVLEEEIEKGTEKIFEEIIARNPLIWESKQPPKSRKYREFYAG